MKGGGNNVDHRANAAKLRTAEMSADPDLLSFLFSSRLPLLLLILLFGILLVFLLLLLLVLLLLWLRCSIVALAIAFLGNLTLAALFGFGVLLGRHHVHNEPRHPC